MLDLGGGKIEKPAATRTLKKSTFSLRPQVTFSGNCHQILPLRGVQSYIFSLQLYSKYQVNDLSISIE